MRKGKVLLFKNITVAISRKRSAVVFDGVVIFLIIYWSVLMRIDTVKTKNRLNMFIRNALCILRGHRFKKSIKHHCGGMFVEGKTYCNRCGTVTETRVIGGI